VFRALALTPLADVRVLILGQDPYHGPGQAEGLAFSVPPGQRLPPSLRNIFNELRRDIGAAPAHSGSLAGWARQGVLLLNSSLTVEETRPASHAKFGWQVLTDQILQAVARQTRAQVFMLWGGHAQAKRPLLQPASAGKLVLQCNHPSPLSATRGEHPFVGCAHFSRARDFLRAAEPGAAVLDWRLSDAGQG
jgi:uracil-DNA glycosylase